MTNQAEKLSGKDINAQTGNRLFEKREARLVLKRNEKKTLGESISIPRQGIIYLRREKKEFAVREMTHQTQQLWGKENFTAQFILVYIVRVILLLHSS